ncbi:MAG: hypothetical protein ABI833_17535 [Acidobacteriota bacterium]
MPPTTGAQWWSTNPNLDCTSIHALIYEVSLASGGTGFACGVTGTFAWLVAGGEWQTSIRAAAPASGAIGVQYVFFDADGKRISLDTASGSLPTSADTVTLALNVNQPSDVRLLGASSDAPQHSATQTGSVLALFFCADPFVCATVLPQLQYFQPAQPWALSVPIAWDNTFSFLQPSGLSNHWSTVGVNDATHNISFALYNQSPALANFIVRVYDSNGTLAAQGVTTQVPGFNSVDGEGGTRGFVLADIVRTPLPAGILKVVVDSATQLSALFLQFSGNSATTLPAAAEPRPAPSINAVRPR